MSSSNMLKALTSADAQFATADFDPTLTDWSFVEPLVIGAGGIGCELLHLLALSGFAHLTVIDMDFIELSNLNRQFLFTHADIGKAKSTVAAAAVMARCPEVSVTAVVGRLEDQTDAFYEQFDVVLLAVDSIPARRWINRKVAQLATRIIVPSAPSSSSSRSSGVVRGVGQYVIDEAKPIIDTGTEGFEGHCRVINMRHNATPCIECEMYLYNDGATRKTVPLCTLESVPRAPEHCVLYVQMKTWPEERGGQGKEGEDGGGAAAAVSLDPDNAEHVRWIAQRARARQEAFGIGGPPIDDMFALGVIKNVVPAVGFTNAYVAGQAVTETLKWLTGCAPGLNNFAFYNGATEAGIFTDVQQCIGSPMVGSGDVAGCCLVCGPRPVMAVDAASVCPAAFVHGVIEEATTDATARAELCEGTASLVFHADGAGGVVEVSLPCVKLQKQQERQCLHPAEEAANGDAAATQVSKKDDDDNEDDNDDEGSLADLLRTAGHHAFVQAWESGAVMATVECIGGTTSRVSALVQWRKESS